MFVGKLIRCPECGHEIGQKGTRFGRNHRVATLRASMPPEPLPASTAPLPVNPAGVHPNDDVQFAARICFNCNTVLPPMTGQGTGVRVPEQLEPDILTVEPGTPFSHSGTFGFAPVLAQPPFMLGITSGPDVWIEMSISSQIHGNQCGFFALTVQLPDTLEHEIWIPSQINDMSQLLPSTFLRITDDATNITSATNQIPAGIPHEAFFGSQGWLNHTPIRILATGRVELADVPIGSIIGLRTFFRSGHSPANTYIIVDAVNHLALNCPEYLRDKIGLTHPNLHRRINWCACMDEWFCPLHKNIHHEGCFEGLDVNGKSCSFYHCDCRPHIHCDCESQYDLNEFQRPDAERGPGAPGFRPLRETARNRPNESYKVGIHGKNSFATTEVALHHEEQTDREVP